MKTNFREEIWEKIIWFGREPSEKYFLKRIDFHNIPQHVAIIMDGNGRWAIKRGLPRLAGHKAGVESIRTISEIVRDLDIKYLTLFAFSTENWQRPKEEVDNLMRLFRDIIDKELQEFHRNDVRLNIFGEIYDLPDFLQEKIKEALELTKNNKKGYLNLAINYGGRAEIIQAVNKICQVAKEKKEAFDRIDERIFKKYLYSSDIPDPDLFIRTAGEYRISNFLLWQIAYTELWVTPVLWPDFNRRTFLHAIYDYQRRERRFGEVGRD